MSYTALFQGLPIRFAGPVKGSESCTLMLDDVVRVLETLGVDDATLSTLTTKASAGTVGFGLLTHWLEDLGQTQVSMFTHWLLRHMPVRNSRRFRPANPVWIDSASPRRRVGSSGACANSRGSRTKRPPSATSALATCTPCGRSIRTS